VSFGTPETTTGGRALPFYAAQRLDMRRIGAIKKGDVTVGNRVRLKTLKNRYAPPYRLHEVDLIFGEGFDGISEILDMSLEEGIITQSGSWLKIGDKTVQGRNSACDHLRDNEELLKQITEEIEEKYVKK
jgi:recombination protein RecA